MVGIKMGVEYAGGVDGLNDLNQLVNHFRLATLTEVWYTLDERHRKHIVQCPMSNVQCHKVHGQKSKAQSPRSKIRLDSEFVRHNNQPDQDRHWTLDIGH